MRNAVIPTFQYHDAPAAIDFLVEAFGFQPHAVFEEDGVVSHAQLTFGDGMVMLGSRSESGYGRMVATPRETGKPTAGVYITVDDPFAHAERARAAGAKIVMEPEEQDYGGANYAALDPEGNIWNFGSYDPWATP
ncbi:MAG: VOC family protein [Actinomycetota bacterium]